jgi:hypothetical protein
MTAEDNLTKLEMMAAIEIESTLLESVSACLRETLISDSLLDR